MKTEKNLFPGWMKAALALTFLALVAGGAWFYKAQEQEQRRQVESQLQAIARLKADQIADWRKERLDEGADLTERPFLSARLARWLANPQAGDTDILAEFRVLQRHGDYSDVLLVDPEGRVRLSLSGLTEIHQAAAQALALALRDRKPMLTDLHAEAHVQTPHIGVVAPLFAGNGQTQQPLGAVVLVSDASQFLYPLIQSWPVPSQTAETLLVRRDGDDVLFLNDLRHQQDVAFKLRIPLSRTDVPAVMAVLGKEGVAEGKDYRGVEVLSVILPIADSPWFMVAKVDAAEAFAVWRFSSVLILALLLGFVALAGAAGLVVWQRNQKAHYRTLFQSEAALRASVERHSITLKAIGDAVIATDGQGRVELLNSVAEALTGWKNEETRGKPLEQVFCIVNEETRDNVENPVARVLREGLVVGLANHTLLIARDGTERPIADSGAPIRDEQGNITGVVLVFRDQTEKRRAEEQIKASLLEKETMLKEIHHRVKNNLQVISSLLALQSSYLQDEKAKELFRNSIDQVKTMANIHTMLYKSEDLSRVDFGGFIRDLAGRLQQSYGIAGSRVEIHVNVSDVSLTIETSIPCGLILNELVSNAIKHAFPEERGGEVNISMTTAGEQFVLTVQDNGIGFPEAVDFQNTKSLGLDLVNLLVGQINGTIDLQVDGGTTLTITFPAVSKGG